MINTSFQQYGIYTSAEPLDGDLIQAYRVYHITNVLSLDRDSGARVSQRILKNRLPIRQSFYHIDPASPSGMASNLFNNVLSVIPASPQNRILIHCSRGKDRTGFAVAAFLIKKGIYKPCDAISAVTNELGYGTGGIGAVQKNSMDRILGCGQVAETEETEDVTEEIKEAYYKYLNLFKKSEDVFDSIDISSVNQIPSFCGPASLKAAMEQYGIFVSMEEIGKIVGCDENGVEAEALVEGAKKFGLDAYFEDNVSVEKIKEMVNKDIPVIVDWFKEDDGHYSVVIDVNDTELQLMDPETGEKVWMVWEEFVPTWFDFKIGDKDHKHLINRRAIFILPREKAVKAAYNASLSKFASTYWGKKASGILFVCSEDNTVLLLKRSNLVHNGGTWGIPGGAIAELGEDYYSESNEEDPEDDLFVSSAKTETFEELGSLPTSFKEIGQTIFRDENFTYKTFVYNLSLKEKKAWTSNIVLNWENDDYRWFDINNLPSNIHPGVQHSLNQLYKPSDVNNAFLGGGPSGSPFSEDQGNQMVPGYIEDTEKRNRRRQRLLKLLSRIEKEETIHKQPSVNVGLGNTYMGGEIANTFNTPSGSPGSPNSASFSEPTGYVQL